MNYISGLARVKNEVINITAGFSVWDLVDNVFDDLDIREATKQDYYYRIGDFLSFVRERGGLYKSVLLDYKQHLRERVDISVSTKNKYLVTARVFLKGLYKDGWIAVDLVQGVKLFEQNKRHKREGFNEQEIRAIASYLQQLGKTKEVKRVRAIVGLLVYQGLRQIEVVRLDVTDIDLNSKTAKIQGKGRDDKELIFLNPRVVEYLREYIEAFQIREGALFFSLSNNSKHKRITTRSLRWIVTRVVREAGVQDKPIHGFRHYFVTRLLKEYNGNIIRVSQFTRHKSLEMLQIYNDAVITQEDLPRFYQAFSQVVL
jgi:integrase